LNIFFEHAEELCIIILSREKGTRSIQKREITKTNLKSRPQPS
jgi:hypothetical protein